MKPLHSFGLSTIKLNGCLLIPLGSKMISLEKYKNSPISNLKIHTHLFYANHLGETVGDKSSKKLNVDSAWKKWRELHQKGWTEITYF